MFSIIVACDNKGGIGKNNKMPWNLPGDMKHFSKTTKIKNEFGGQNFVIMGRKTFESIPKKFRPLSNRINVVITRNKNYKTDNNVFVAHSFDEALQLAKDINKNSKIFVIGGAEIYKEAFNHKDLNEIFLTKIHNSYDCDTFVDLKNLTNYIQTEIIEFVENETCFDVIKYVKK